MAVLEPSPPAARPRVLPRWPAILLAAALALVLRACFPPVFCDDAFITLRAAYHAVHGGGLAFNAGEPVYLTTTPLWALLLAALQALGLSPLVALAVLGTLSELLLAAALVELGAAVTGRPSVGVVAAFLLFTNPVFLLTSHAGMELPLDLAAIAITLAMMARGRRTAALTLAALAIWVRVDAILLLAAIALAVALRRPRPTLRELAPVALVILAYVAFGLALFGQAIPAVAQRRLADVSLLRWWWWDGMARIAREFVRTAFLGRSSSVYVANSVMAALLVPFAVGLVTLVRQRAREVLPALLFAALYVAVFLLSGSTTATGYPWYFVPPALVVALVAGAGTMWLMDALRSRPPLPRRGLAARALALTPALLWAVLMMPTVALDLGQVRQLAAVREQPFAAASRWLSRRLPARAVIASNEIGAAGWYARPDVYVLDLHGLSLPRAQRSLTRVQLIQHYRPQAILMRDVFGPHFAGVIDAPGYRWTSLRSLAIGVREDLADSLLAHEDELPVELGRVRRGL